MAKVDSSKLAIFGGEPVRKEKMPARRAFGDEEEAALKSVADYYRQRDADPPYQGVFEEQFCGAFSDFMGGGYSDAVSTGTASVYVALAALDLPGGSEVIISPVTDSGPLAAIIMLGLTPVVADSAPGSYNMGPEQVLERVTSSTSAVLAVHSGGEPLEIDRIVEELHKRGIKVLEDCSQATGAVCNGKRVGSFGDIAAFSTMYRKALATGGSGGLVFTKDLDLHRRGLGYADRGKQAWRTDLDLRNPGFALFPSLNFNSNEFACAIGLASLRRLQDTIDKRQAFLRSLVNRIRSESRVCSPYAFHDGFSPFFFPVFVDSGKISCSKTEFAEALAAEGIGLGAHYGCLVRTWEWAEKYLSDDFMTVNAVDTRDRSFNLYVNERYGDQEVEDTIAAIRKVEDYFMVR